MQFAAGERKVRFHLLSLDVGVGRAICNCATIPVHFLPGPVLFSLISEQHVE